MRVVRLRAAGGPDQLAVEEADTPRPGPTEALVRVHAAAITRDELQCPSCLSQAFKRRRRAKPRRSA
jgi:D-arabinose 1-dehydrogenase-like Zn-dependent alcohol dehydrogenase